MLAGPTLSTWFAENCHCVTMPPLVTAMPGTIAEFTTFPNSPRRSPCPCGIETVTATVFSALSVNSTVTGTLSPAIGVENW